eukprot:2098950-Rhodomonas_salina.2
MAGANQARMGHRRAGLQMQEAAAEPKPAVEKAEKKKPKVAVVGAGWGGWAAAKALCENGCEVSRSGRCGKSEKYG